MSKKISELTETIEPQDSDVLAIVNGNETKKVTIASIITKIKTALNSVYAAASHKHVKADITDFPTKVSELENDSGFLTEETDPSVPEHVKNITEDNITAWNGKSDFSGSYNDLSDVPSTFPPTTHNHNDTYYTETEIDAKIGDIETILATLTTGSGV